MSNVPPGPDILADPLFTTTDENGEHETTPLPSLLARLLTGPQVWSFPQVTAEQRGYWWRFLVRCAAKALHDDGLPVAEVGRQDPRALGERVHQALRAAAPEGAWCLYQPDPERAGFLQPPTPDGAPPEQGYAANTLSLLTSAIGSKNHERKVDVGRVLDAEQAVYALVEYQTGAIFGGRGNYGSQLMGSAAGAGSGTPFMGVRLGTGENETFLHDVSVLLGSWSAIQRESGLRGSVWALWAEPWDGVGSLPAARLEPAFIPLARLVRLAVPAADGRFDAVFFKPSSVARVRDHTGGGTLGDPFTPRVPDLKDASILKVRGALERGYDYLEVVNLLFGAGKRPGRPSPSVAALQGLEHEGRGDVRVLFEGTAYEQGKTVGFYRREILLPASGVDADLADPAPVRVAHGEMLARVQEAKSALRGAMRVLLSGSAKPHDGDAAKADVAAARFEAEVDRHYLPFLLRAAEEERAGDTLYRERWNEQISTWAVAAFREGIHLLPTSVARRREREVRAEAWLGNRLRVLRGAVRAADDNEAIDLTSEREEISV